MQIKEKMTSRDGARASMWQAHQICAAERQVGIDNSIYDTLIIGAGITGVTTALMLQQQGKRCILLEAHRVGFGTTAGTSAHLNTFFDATYPEVEKDFGPDAAKLLAQAGKESLSIIQNFIQSFAIDCDYQTKAAVLFAENEQQAKELTAIIESSGKAGVEMTEIPENPIAVDAVMQARIEDQAQFHPLKYVDGLLREYLRLGGILVENATVTQINFEDDIHVAKLSDDHPSVKAQQVVYATHIPPGLNLYNLKCAPYRSYVIAVKLKDNAYPQELIYDLKEPYHYFRTHSIDGQPLLLIGGEDHKTGHDTETAAEERLRNYAYQHFAVDNVIYSWSSQYYVPADGLPYIGKLSGRGKVYVATGYNGNGMIFGTLAGKLISDIILGQVNSYQDLFNPLRIKPVAGFAAFVKENADAAVHFVKDRLTPETIHSFNDILPDEGRVVDWQGKKMAIYKNQEGKIYPLNAVCSHAGCIVKWNALEKSWDCPCHGGRFNQYGQVLTGPPQRDLQALWPEEK